MNIYGLSNCDITREALKWMKKHNVPFSFHDFKQERLSKQRVENWMDKIDADLLLNKKSTTWRSLSNQEQQKAAATGTLVNLLIDYPALIKRPLIEWPDGSITTGFNTIDFDNKLFSASA